MTERAIWRTGFIGVVAAWLAAGTAQAGYSGGNYIIDGGTITATTLSDHKSELEYISSTGNLTIEGSALQEYDALENIFVLGNLTLGSHSLAGDDALNSVVCTIMRGADATTFAGCSNISINITGQTAGSGYYMSGDVLYNGSTLVYVPARAGDSVHVKRGTTAVLPGALADSLAYVLYIPPGLEVDDTAWGGNEMKNECEIYYHDYGTILPEGIFIACAGKTTVTLPDGVFSLLFTLENHDGPHTWKVASREGGSIASNGLYTWSPAQAGEYTLKVAALEGESVLAEREVLLTVNPIPGVPTLVFGGANEGKVGGEVAFTVKAVNVADPTVCFNGCLFPEESSLTDADILRDWPNVRFTPDAAGPYTFEFFAGEEGVDFVKAVFPIMVTDEEPPSELPKITKVEVDTDGGRVTLEFTGNPSAVWGTDDLSDADSWTPVEADMEGNIALVEMDKPFLRVQ